MQYYFAPMEGLTDSIYRQLHSRYFPGITKYYTPFFSPTVHRTLTPKEQRELPSAENLSYPIVPQILTKNPEDFLWLATQCSQLGYCEVNLNLGCPSGTVTAKGKGAGMLKDPEALDAFLYTIFSAAPLDISVKTRIGFTDKREFPALMEIFNRYPICELIIHPRTRSDFYSGNVDMEAFRYALQSSKCPVCFNGNLCSLQDINEFENTFPQLQAVMLGRGLIGNPGMLSVGGTDAGKLEAFYDALLESYTQNFGSTRNAMFRLKENWRYLIRLFDGGEKLYKRLRKTTDVQEYRAITKELFHNVPLRKELSSDW